MSNSVKIMTLGDSITAGLHSEETGGYRGPLSQMFADVGFPVEFVGSQADQISKHEGHSGFTSDMIAQNVRGWLESNPPEIVLLHIGTNDVLLHTPCAITNIEQILKNIDSFETSTNTHIAVFLAQIINRTDVGSVPGDTTALNKLIASMAAARITNGDRLKVVNFEQALITPWILPMGSIPMRADTARWRWYGSTRWPQCSTTGISPRTVTRSIF